jgi:hypothetical protein
MRPLAYEDIDALIKRYVTLADWRTMSQAKKRGERAFDRTINAPVKRVRGSERARAALRERLMHDDGTDAAWQHAVSDGFLRRVVRPAPGAVR